MKKADPKIDEKLSTDNAKSYLLNVALNAMQRINENGGRISQSNTVDEVTKEYFVDSDTILGFITQKGISENLTTKAVYEEYERYCDESGAKPYSQTKFTQRLKGLGYTRERKMMMGRRYYCYKFTNDEANE